MMWVSSVSGGDDGTVAQEDLTAATELANQKCALISHYHTLRPSERRVLLTTLGLHPNLLHSALWWHACASERRVLLTTRGLHPNLLHSAPWWHPCAGSGRNFQAYVFSKIKPESEAFIRRALPLSPTAPCTTAPLPVGSNTQAAATVATARVESATQEAADVTPSELVAAANVDASIAQPQAQPQVPHAVQVPLLQQWSGKGVVELLPPLQQPLQPPAAKEGAHMQSTTVAAAAAGDDSLQGFMCYQQQEGDGKSGLPLQSAAAAAVATGGDDSVQGFTHHQQHQDDGESGLPQYLLPGTPACGDPIRVGPAHRLARRVQLNENDVDGCRGHVATTGHHKERAGRLGRMKSPRAGAGTDLQNGGYSKSRTRHTLRLAAQFRPVEARI
eukprot:1114757-Pelagomonas_calceolata.AAC.1